MANLKGGYFCETQDPGYFVSFLRCFWRFVACLSVLAVLLAGVAYAEDGDPVDPPDPDYGGTADQDPAADLWIDPGYVSDVDYSVQPYSQSSPNYWTTTEINNVNQMAVNLMSGSGTRSIVTMNLHLQSIETAVENLSSRFSSTNVSNIVSYLGDIGDNTSTSASRLLNVYNRLGDVITNIQSTNSKLDTVNTNLTSIGTKLDTVNTKLTTVIEYIGNTNIWISRVRDLLVGTNSRLDISNTWLDKIYNRLLGDYYHVLDDNPFNITSGLYQLAYVDDSTKLIPLSPASNGYFASQSVSSFRAFEMVRYPDRTSSVNAVSSISPVLLSDSYYVMSFSFPSTTVLTSQSVVAFTVGSVPITSSDIFSFSYSNYLGNSIFTIVFKPSTSVALDRFRIVLSNLSNMVSGGYVRFVFAEAPDQIVSQILADKLDGSVTTAGQGIQDKIESSFDTSESADLGSSAKGFADQASASLGVVSYVDTVFSGLSGLVVSGSTALTFPSVSIEIEGSSYQLWPDYTFDLAELDGWLSGLMAVVRLATSAVVVGAVISYLQHVYKEVIG